MAHSKRPSFDVVLRRLVSFCIKSAGATRRESSRIWDFVLVRSSSSLLPYLLGEDRIGVAALDLGQKQRERGAGDADTEEDCEGGSVDGARRIWYEADRDRCDG
jgi:hypothetical protein